MSTHPLLSHRDIIDRAGGPAEFGRQIGVVSNTTKAWARQNSIPPAYWWKISNSRVASLEELALASAAKGPKTRTR
jgi:hypothetical protein